MMATQDQEAPVPARREQLTNTNPVDVQQSKFFHDEKKSELKILLVFF